MRARFTVLLLAPLSLYACSEDDPAGPGGSGGAVATQAASTSSGGPGPATTSGGATSSASQGGGGVGGSGGGPLTVAQCYEDDFVNPPLPDGPDYDQFSPVVGSHCMGTNHQDITGVERVVFLGDSVTVGTPPTLSADYYRSQLADALAQKFGLQAPSGLWKAVNFLDGTSLLMEDGAFASCSKWGARTDDLLQDGTQLEDCLPVEERDKRTLVIMTMGGNDISSLTQDAIDGIPMDQLWMSTQDFVQRMEDAVAWILEPGRFPNGVFVVFANMYEFTDGTGEVQSCDVSGLAGFDEPIPAPDDLAAMVIWANEQYVRIAVDHGADVIFMLEDFCGHGFERDNTAGPCYRGPNTPGWFDLTCIHPNPAGHDHITDMFMAVVNE
jgi:lysophospholipase L1-like esterase